MDRRHHSIATRDAVIADLRTTGDSMRVIATRHGVSKSFVSDTHVQFKIQRLEPPDPVDLALRADPTKSYAEIAAELGVGYARVAKAATRAGLTRSSRSRKR